jgi:hypothetical protein
LLFVTFLIGAAIAAFELHPTLSSRIPERSPVFFVATMDNNDVTDLTSYPLAPEVARLSFRGSTFYARMTNVFRLIAHPEDSHEDSDARQLYCRIPQPLAQDEYRNILTTDVLENAVRIQRAHSGIHDVLQALDCFEGDGDSTYRSPPTMYRYCPHGKLTLLTSKVQQDITATNPPQEQGRDEKEEDHIPTLHDYGQFEGDNDVDSPMLVGWYDPSLSPMWNVEREQWELPLAPGGLCPHNTSTYRGVRRHSAKIVFRCHRARNSGKTTWLIYHEKDSCDYVVEMETAAVCDWHSAIANIYKCPIPCLVV